MTDKPTPSEFMSCLSRRDPARAAFLNDINGLLTTSGVEPIDDDFIQRFLFKLKLSGHYEAAYWRRSRRQPTLRAAYDGGVFTRSSNAIIFTYILKTGLADDIDLRDSRELLSQLATQQLHTISDKYYSHDPRRRAVKIRELQCDFNSLRKNFLAEVAIVSLFASKVDGFDEARRPVAKADEQSTPQAAGPVG